MRKTRKKDGVFSAELIDFGVHIPRNEYHLEIDLKTAEDLISDAMAKTLVYRRKSVKTWGKKSVSVQLDVIGALFGDGERIDINVLKNKGVIPSDALRVKLVGAGKINRAFAVYANRFTPGAIKMIALAGGAAIKVRSIKIRRPHPSDE